MIHILFIIHYDKSIFFFFSLFHFSFFNSDFFAFIFFLILSANILLENCIYIFNENIKYILKLILLLVIVRIHRFFGEIIYIRMI